MINPESREWTSFGEISEFCFGLVKMLEGQVSRIKQRQLGVVLVWFGQENRNHASSFNREN